MRLEVRRDLRVGGRHAVLELVGGEGHDGELDLLVAPVEFGRSRSVSATVIQSVSAPCSFSTVMLRRTCFLELGGLHRRVLHLEQLPVALVADEVPVLLERRERQDPLRAPRRRWP